MSGVWKAAIAPAAWRLIHMKVAETGATFRYRLNREKLNIVLDARVGICCAPILPRPIR